MLADEEILWIVNILVRACLYAVDDLPSTSARPSGRGSFPCSAGVLLVRDQSVLLGECILCRRSVNCLISTASRRCVHQSLFANLVKEDILAIPTFGREILQITILVDPVLLT